jgi:hypothetical protein
MASFHAFTYSCPLQGRNIRLLEVRSGLGVLEVSIIEKALTKQNLKRFRMYGAIKQEKY